MIFIFFATDAKCRGIHLNDQSINQLRARQSCSVSAFERAPINRRALCAFCDLQCCRESRPALQIPGPYRSALCLLCVAHHCAHRPPALPVARPPCPQLDSPSSARLSVVSLLLCLAIASPSPAQTPVFFFFFIFVTRRYGEPCYNGQDTVLFIGTRPSSKYKRLL